MRRRFKPSAEHLALITSMLSVYWPDISATLLVEALDGLDAGSRVPPTLTMAEAAEALRVTRRTVQTMLKDGRLERIELGPRECRVSAESLRRLIAGETTNEKGV